MNREGSLDTNAEADLADGECFLKTATLTTDDNTLEQLDTLAIAFNNSDMHLERVAGGELGHVVTEALGVDQIDGVHWDVLAAMPAGRRGKKRNRDRERLPEGVVIVGGPVAQRQSAKRPSLNR
jgi:hypothetical protein